MNRERTTLVILAAPGPVRDGLAALFGADRGLSVTVLELDWDDALDRLRRAPPGLIVLEGGLVQQGVADTLAQLRAAAPGSARLVLVDNVAQLAPAGVAEVIMLKGAPAVELVAALQSLQRP